MAYAFTPGLRVSAATLIEKERVLPLDGEVLVEVGQKVKAEDVVARTELPGEVETVNVVGRLAIEPSDIRRYMLKKEGDRVKAGEPIAETKPLIKWFKTVIKSPVDGTIESISEVTGQVLIRLPSKPVEVHAYIDGVVSKTIPKQGCVIRTYATFIQGIFGIGKERWGTLRLRADGPDETLTAERISDDDRGAILVAGALATKEAILKAFECGVVGIITGGLNAVDIKAILGYDIGVAITGHEEIPTTIVVTEGFGKLTMAQRTWELLARCDGKKASISGATQIRAGVIRPEVIVPLGEDVPAEAPQKERDALKEGDTVRIIRAPYFGLIGTVTKLIPELQKVESESRLRVLQVRLKNGEVLTVPRANVELVEE